MQFRFAVDKFELFEREVPLQVGEHDVAATRFNGAIDDENVTLEDAGIDHGVAACFDNESRIAVFHEVVVERQIVFGIVRSRGGKAALNRQVNELDAFGLFNGTSGSQFLERHCPLRCRFKQGSHKVCAAQ